MRMTSKYNIMKLLLNRNIYLCNLPMKEKKDKKK